MSGAGGAGVGLRRAHFGAGQQDLYQPAVSLSQTVCPHQLDRGQECQHSLQSVFSFMRLEGSPPVQMSQIGGAGSQN